MSLTAGADQVSTDATHEEDVKFVTIAASANLIPATHRCVAVNATTGNINLLLPTAASSEGVTFFAKRTVTSSNSINFVADGSEEIDDSTDPLPIVLLNEFIAVRSNGVQWLIVNKGTSSTNELAFDIVTSAGPLTAINTEYDPDTNGTAIFTLPTPSAALDGAERYMFRDGDANNYIEITGNICGVASQRIIGLIDEYYGFKCDGTTWREFGHSTNAFATLQQTASDTFSITTSFTKFDTWDGTPVFSTPGRLFANAASDQIDILEFEGPVADGYAVACTISFEYTSNQT